MFQSLLQCIRSRPDKPVWDMVDVQYVKHLERYLTLDELREHADGSLSGMLLFSRFRLSVMPVMAEHWHAILALAAQPRDDGGGNRTTGSG
jgi:predicted RNA-binding protein with PUA-like domain